MENKTSGTNRCTTSNSTSVAEMTESSVFFPSLEVLHLWYLPKLKGWLGKSTLSGSGMEDDEIMSGHRDSNMQTTSGHRLPPFPCLSELTIGYCPRLTTIPLCPTVDTLKLYEFNESLRIMIKEEDQKQVGGSNDSGNLSHDPKIRVLETSNARYLKSRFMVAFRCLTGMRLSCDHSVVSLSEVEEVFCSCSSSLRSLEISHCSILRSVSGGLVYLTTLESLELVSLPKLRFDETEEEEEDCAGKPWRCLAQSLHSLKLHGIKKVVDLPKGMRYLIGLQTLQIASLPLKDLPEWIGCLSSLQSLTIENCKLLESLPEALLKLTSLQKLELKFCSQVVHQRCKEPDGEDWPKIKNIPNMVNWASIFSDSE